MSSYTKWNAWSRSASNSFAVGNDCVRTSVNPRSEQPLRLPFDKEATTVNVFLWVLQACSPPCTPLPVS